MSAFPHAFDAPIGRFGVGRERKIWYTVVFLPGALDTELPFERFPRLRVEGEIAGDVPIQGAWIPTGDGRRYLIVSRSVLKRTGLKVGDVVDLRFRIADPHAVDVPAELAAALARDAAASAAWESLTAGKRRGLAHLVGSAKTDATRARRVVDAIGALRSGEAARPPARRTGTTRRASPTDPSRAPLRRP